MRSNRDNEVAGQGAFSLLCHLHPEVVSVQRFIPLVQDASNTKWSFASGVSEPRASILDVTDKWKGVFSTFVGIPDEGRNTSQDNMVFDDRYPGQKVYRRVSARKYGMHKVQILGDKDVAFGDLALLGPAVHTPNSRAKENDPDNPYVGVYPVKRRTIFFVRNDEFKAEVGKINVAGFAALCLQHCPWTLLPALAAADEKGSGADAVSTVKALYDAQVLKPKVAGVPVFQKALLREYNAIKDLTIKEAHALYQWMMVSQMIGVFVSPASPQSWAQILLK